GGAQSVRVRDQGCGRPAPPAAEIEIRGLAPASMTYGANRPNGNFADGITMWAGYGDDTITIDGTHERANALPGGGTMRTITTLNTGLGNDNVTANLTAGQDGFFVLNTQGPYNEFRGYTLGTTSFHAYRDQDKVYGQGSTLPLIVFGGQDDDVIVGGEGDDLIFGDRGRVLYYLNATDIAPISETIGDVDPLAIESNAVAVLGHGGHLDKTDGVVRPAIVAISVYRLIGGTDTLYGNGGQDVLIGGAAGDFVDGGNEKDLIFGDNVALQRRVVG